ncbi:hypothetical protein bcgnr5379_63260 [Bacillus cereus]
MEASKRSGRKASGLKSLPPKEKRIRFHRISRLRRMALRLWGFEAIGKKGVGTEVPPTLGSGRAG